jgi:hypothetical protein
MLAQRQLVERVGTAGAHALNRALANPANPEQHVHALWASHQLRLLDPSTLAAAAGARDAAVRVHAMRVLSETGAHCRRPGRPDAPRAPGPRRPRPPRRGRRLGRHPSAENVRPLLAARDAVPPADTHLLHTIRMALRNQLESGTVLGAMPALQLTDDEQRGLADVVMAVGNPDVGSLVMSYLKRGITDPARTAQLLLHAARRLPAADVDSLAQTVLQRFPADLDLQRQLFVSVIEGLAQRGASPGELTRRWGVDLAKQLAVAMPFDGSAWTYHPLPGAPAAAGTTAANPFVAQRRPLNDPAGKSLWSSHPAGEQLTGVLRSRPFAIPQKLGFLLAGHYGAPSAGEASKNVVRLKLVKGEETVAEAPTPRDDAPRRVEWDLSKWAGPAGLHRGRRCRRPRLYAWLAFGQFEPAVVPTPEAGEQAWARIAAAAAIARLLKVADLRGRMEEVVNDPFADAEARAGAARALGVTGSAQSVKVLAGVAADPVVPPAVREAVSQALGGAGLARGA